MPDVMSHCARIVREDDKDRYLAALFAPASAREALFALYAFNIEVARIREHVREAMAGEIRLQWWRDAIEGGGGEAGAHPVAAALRDTIARFSLPAAPLLDLIEARSFDLYDDPMPTLEALEGYAAKTSTVLIETAVLLLDRSGAVPSVAARPAGIAYAVTGLLRAFALHAARGQLYVPLEVLTRHGANQEDVFAGRDTPAIRAALAEMRSRARAHHDAYAGVAAVPPHQAPALLPAALVPLYLDRMERARDMPFAVAEVPQWRRQWALWRAARRMG